jgi:hypothetical protein
MVIINAVDASGHAQLIFGFGPGRSQAFWLPATGQIVGKALDWDSADNWHYHFDLNGTDTLVGGNRETAPHGSTARPPGYIVLERTS